MKQELIDKVIKAKYIMCLDNDSRIIEDGFLAINGEFIKDIGKKNELHFKAKETLDLGNSLVMPGLINTHTHAAMTYFRGMADDLELDTWLNKYIWPAESEMVNPDFINKASELACLELISSGVTMFNDMYFYTDLSAQVADRAGLRVMAGDVILDFPSASAKNPDEALRRYDEMQVIFKDRRRVDVALNPHSIYTCSRTTLEKVVDKARDKNLPIHIHLSETEKELKDSYQKNGCSPLKYLDDLALIKKDTVLAHSIWINDEDIDIIKDRGAKISHNPISNMKLASGVMPLGKLKGVSVALGSDGAASNNTLDMFSEMRVCSLLHKSANSDPAFPSAEKILRMATIDAARVLGKEEEIGSLEIGKQADLISIDLDKSHLSPVYNLYSHLVYSVNSGDVENTMVAGEWLMRDKIKKTLDEDRVLREASEYAKKIKKFTN